MAYPRDNLAPGEEVVLHRHPHWKCLTVGFAVFLMVTAVAGLLGGVISGADLGSTTTTVLLIVVGAGWLCGFVWYFVRPLISWKSTHFVVTDRRVMFRDGIVARSGIDIPIRRINTVEFRRGLLDRMLHTGTLVIESASEDPLYLRDVPHVEQVHGLLYNEVLDSADGDDRFDEERQWPRTGVRR